MLQGKIQTGLGKLNCKLHICGCVACLPFLTFAVIWNNAIMTLSLDEISLIECEQVKRRPMNRSHTTNQFSHDLSKIHICSFLLFFKFFYLTGKINTEYLITYLPSINTHCR